MEETSLPITVLPSYPAPTLAALQSLFEALDGVASAVQVDMVDGVFAPFVSWPCTETDVHAALKKLAPYTTRFALEFDCMLECPEQYLDTLVAVGARSVVVHMGSTDAYHDIIAHARRHTYMIGLALVNDTPLEVLDPYIDAVDFVQLMGIHEIGQQGQPFDERTLKRITTLRRQYPLLTIAVDGSVNAETIPALRAAGANKFAPGSAITQTAEPKAAFTALRDLALL